MDVELVVVGAHNGNKLSSVIRTAAAKGPTVLVEPVRWLFEDLRSTFQDLDNVFFINKALVTAKNVSIVTFNAPKRNANSFNSVADQLGSMVLEHAQDSVPGVENYFERVRVPATTFQGLFEDLYIKSINGLIIDTEGMDMELLMSFPFYQIKPREILFEFKHADGTMKVGKNLANVLIRLTDMGYEITPVDHENFYALLK